MSKQFAADFDLVTTTWMRRGEHTPKEIDHLRACLRVELSPGAGLPHPVVNGKPVEGWIARSHDERVQCYSDVFADWADQIRHDQARADRIRAEMQARKAA